MRQSKTNYQRGSSFQIESVQSSLAHKRNLRTYSSLDRESLPRSRWRKLVSGVNFISPGERSVRKLPDVRGRISLGERTSSLARGAV